MKEQIVNFPLKNNDFLSVISNSFRSFIINGGTSRSTAKLKPLHGAIAKDLQGRLGNSYKVISQGYGVDKEASIKGRYIDKKVDITITKQNKTVAGFAIKFVMQNYSQNSNNYFENMLGETANIRSNRIPYFHIFIILDNLPYYNSKHVIQKWETFTAHNARKYIVLSHDDENAFYHTPDKTLIFVVHPPKGREIHNKEDYDNFYSINPETLSLADTKFEKLGDSVILNDYETFIDKSVHRILSI